VVSAIIAIMDWIFKHAPTTANGRGEPIKASVVPAYASMSVSAKIKLITEPLTVKGPDATFRSRRFVLN
jgi:hypothetical protein